MKAGLQWGRTSGARCLSTVLCLGHKRKSGWGRSWEISKSHARSRERKVQGGEPGLTNNGQRELGLAKEPRQGNPGGGEK